MIKAVIWDVGGVLVHNPRIETFWRDVLNSKDTREQFGSGKLSIEDFVSRGATLLKVTKTEFMRLYRDAYSNSKMDESVLELYKSMTCERYILSDTNPLNEELGADVREAVYKLSKKTFLSHKIKMRKLNPKTYLYVISEIGYKPQELLFIDDREENVRLARRAGLHAICYKNPKQLKRDLKLFKVIP